MLNAKHTNMSFPRRIRDLLTFVIDPWLPRTRFSVRFVHGNRFSQSYAALHRPRNEFPPEHSYPAIAGGSPLIIMFFRK